MRRAVRRTSLAEVAAGTEALRWEQCQRRRNRQKQNSLAKEEETLE